MLSKENKEILIKRLKSFGWRSTMMVLAGAVAFALENLSLLELSPTVTVVLGLILGEVSKALNPAK